MKKVIITTFSLLLISGTLLAQRGPKDFDYDKFKAEKVAFITEFIDLTPDEAQKFWPVYNEYEKKKWELIKEHRKTADIIKEGIDGKTDKEYIDLSRKLSSLQYMEGQLSSNYNEKFLEVLPPRKVVELYMAEFEFRGTMLRKYKNRDGGDSPGRGRNH